MVERADFADAPLQGFTDSDPVPRDVAATGSTLTEFACLSEFLFPRRSGLLVHRSLRVVRDDHEVFRRETGSDASVRTSPSGLGRPLRAPASLPVGSRSHQHPLLGFGAPSATSATGSASPGLASPGTFRPRGFSPPRRFAPLPRCDLDGRCHSWGFRSRYGFDRLGCDTLPRREPVVCSASRPRTLRNTRSSASLAQGPSPSLPWGNSPEGSPSHRLGNSPSELVITRPLRRPKSSPFPSRAFVLAWRRTASLRPAPQGLSDQVTSGS